MMRWYDKLKNIAEENTRRFWYRLPAVEPTLHEVEYDQIKQEIWDTQIFPNLAEYYSTHGSIKPLSHEKIRVKYETYKVDKKGMLKEEPFYRSKEMVFPEFVMCGIPTVARNLLYPMIIKNHYNENYFDILERKAELKTKKGKFKPKLK